MYLNNFGYDLTPHGPSQKNPRRNTNPKGTLYNSTCQHMLSSRCDQDERDFPVSPLNVFYPDELRTSHGVEVGLHADHRKRLADDKFFERATVVHTEKRLSVLTRSDHDGRSPRIKCLFDDVIVEHALNVEFTNAFAKRFSSAALAAATSDDFFLTPQEHARDEAALFQQAVTIFQESNHRVMQGIFTTGLLPEQHQNHLTHSTWTRYERQPNSPDDVFGRQPARP